MSIQGVSLLKLQLSVLLQKAVTSASGMILRDNGEPSNKTLLAVTFQSIRYITNRVRVLCLISAKQLTM